MHAYIYPRWDHRSRCLSLLRVLTIKSSCLSSIPLLDVFHFRPCFSSPFFVGLSSTHYLFGLLVITFIGIAFKSDYALND